MSVVLRALAHGNACVLHLSNSTANRVVVLNLRPPLHPAVPYRPGFSAPTPTKSPRFPPHLPPATPSQAICLYSSGAAFSGQNWNDWNNGVWIGGAPRQKKALAANFTGQTFALTFTSAREERFTTTPINLDGTTATPAAVTAAYIEDALEGLPGGVIDSVSVDVEGDSDGSGILGVSIDNYPCDMLIVVTFDGTEVRASSCVVCVRARVSLCVLCAV